MISYITFFKQILNQYIAKKQNDPHFFNGRADQEAMGFMVAVNAFREELAHPTTKKFADKPSIQKNLPTVISKPFTKYNFTFPVSLVTL